MKFVKKYKKHCSYEFMCQFRILDPVFLNQPSAPSSIYDMSIIATVA